MLIFNINNFLILLQNISPFHILFIKIKRIFFYYNREDVLYTSKQLNDIIQKEGIMTTINAVTQELHKAFELFNERFFENKLPIPAITIQTSRHNKLSMGWCSVYPIWSDKKGENKRYEINISAEYVDQDFFETMDTLMHEMVHLYNIVHDIQDCSRNETYHNKHFKNRAIKSGFEYEEDKPDPKYGWSFARLSQQTKDIISKMDIDQSVFSIARRLPRYLQPFESKKKHMEMVLP